MIKKAIWRTALREHRARSSPAARALASLSSSPQIARVSRFAGGFPFDLLLEALAGSCLRPARPLRPARMSKPLGPSSHAAACAVRLVRAALLPEQRGRVVLRARAHLPGRRLPAPLALRERRLRSGARPARAARPTAALVSPPATAATAVRATPARSRSAMVERAALPTRESATLALAAAERPATAEAVETTTPARPASATASSARRTAPRSSASRCPAACPLLRRRPARSTSRRRPVRSRRRPARLSWSPTLYWKALALDPSTTLHDVRWGEHYKGPGSGGKIDAFVWLLPQISGAAPANHFVDGYAGATSERQPAMYFPLGGGSLKGVGKPGEIVWSRIFVEGGALHADLGRGSVVSLPTQETERRWRESTPQWPIVHAILHGVSQNQMMARHRANHLNVAYATSAESADRALATKAAMLAELDGPGCISAA